jgi:serine O-acetyltransferase
MPLDDLRDDLARYPGSRRARVLSALPQQGFWAVVVYRLGRSVYADRSLLRLLTRPLYKLLKKATEIATGIDLPVDARIGPGLYIGHFGGVIVSPHAVIGRRCNLSPGVVIGVDGIGHRRGAPRIGDEVWIGPGAKAFGPIEIGDGVAIGANSVVNSDVPPGVTVAGIPAVIVGRRGSTGRIEIEKTAAAGGGAVSRGSGSG